MTGIYEQIYKFIDREFANIRPFSSRIIDEIGELLAPADGIALFEIKHNKVNCFNQDSVPLSLCDVPSYLSMLDDVSNRYALPNI